MRAWEWHLGVYNTDPIKAHRPGSLSDAFGSLHASHVSYIFVSEGSEMSADESVKDCAQLVFLISGLFFSIGFILLYLFLLLFFFWTIPWRVCWSPAVQKEPSSQRTTMFVIYIPHAASPWTA